MEKPEIKKVEIKEALECLEERTGMRKSGMRGAAVLLMGVFLTGCGNAIPEMTQEEQALVVEYAANELLKYDTGYETRLTLEELSREPLEDAVQEAAEEKVPEEEMEASKSAEDGSKAASEDKGGSLPDEVEVIDNTAGEAVLDISMEEFLKLEGAELTYTGCEVTDSYPSEKKEDEFFFFMSATEGKKLLVLKFELTNISDGELALDMAKTDTRYKIIADGEEKNALTTLLLNDLAYYQGTVEPGQSVELVLVGEVSEGEKAESLQLKMKSVDNSATISLN